MNNAKVLYLLSIGNSFSEDAHKHLHAISQTGNCRIEAYNLYIGGCSLERAAMNVQNGRADYLLEINAEKKGYISIEEALKLRQFDVVTVQQVSNLAGQRESYEPYLERILHKIKELQFEPRMYLHETWAYDDEKSPDSRATLARESKKRQIMFKLVSSTCNYIASKYSLKIIPTGDVIEQLRESAYFKTTDGSESFVFSRKDSLGSPGEKSLNTSTQNAASSAQTKNWGGSEGGRNEDKNLSDSSANKDFPYHYNLPSLTRDGHHLNEQYGRLAAALTWYATIAGEKSEQIEWLPLDFGKGLGESEKLELAEFIRKTVDEVVARY